MMEYKYVKIPFVPNKCGFDGCDCLGLIALFYREEFGIDIHPPMGQYNFYKAASTRKTRVDCQASQGTYNRMIDSGVWQEVPIAQALRGDIITFVEGGMVTHVGMYHSPGNMLHTQSNSGAGVVRYTSLELRNSLYKVYRHVDRINCAA